MGSNKILTILIILLVSSVTIAQDSREPERKELEKRTEEFIPDNIQPGDDFRIIGSTNSYIEIEFNPIYLSAFNFVGAVSRSTVGSPDVKFRSFPLFLPGATNNRIEILDYKYEDIPNVDILPVPTPVRSQDNMQIDFQFRKNEEAYATNGFFPNDAATLDAVSLFRNKYLSNAVVNPILYNPVTKTVRRYKYIRFRISFGSSPISTNKQQSYEEILFFRDMALNSSVAMNWSTPEFNNVTDSYPANSVLQSGDFYKIEVRETGMYKIDKGFLQNAGINVDGIDPRTIKIYGNGGREIPFNNSIPFPTDLVENRIMVAGEDDGVFNDGDYIVFYGRSQSDWTYNPAKSTSIAPYNHYTNPFSKSNYYWITFGNSNGLRMQLVNSQNSQNPMQLPYFYEKFFDEADVNNLGSTGTLWFSQRIGPGESFNFNKTLTGYVSGQPVEITALYGNGTRGTSAYFEFNESASGYNSIFQVFGFGDEFSHINLSNHRFTITPGSENVNLRISLPSNLNAPTVIGYYDWVEFKYPRRFTSAVNNYLGFQANDTTGLFEYNLSTFSTSDINIFDVTDEYNISRINPISYNGGTAKFQVNHTQGTPGQYYAVGGTNYKTPISISSKVPNQNLHGITDGASFVIISPKEFMSAAQRLKNLREKPGPSYLKTIIVDIDEIYNEFSGGLLDPMAVRNFLKKAFNTWNERPVYVFFLGDGHYDYRNIYNLPGKNFLPPMQKSDMGANEILSYPSDDFVTNINDTINGNTQAVRPDFSIGRLCVNSLNEANSYIDKLVKYEDPSTFGYWKKKNMYVADDGWTTSNPGGEGALHTQQCEFIAEIETPADFEKEKIYIVNYPTVITPQGRRKPQANVDIIRGWNEGRLVINYTGHGSNDLWAHEQIFERQSSIPQLNNSERFPFVTIASCDLARYDDPFFPSAAEELTNLSNRGSIGIIAAVRPVYASSNAQFNEALWSNFMFLKDTLNLPIRIGRAVYNTKQIHHFDNDAKYTLLCDPSLRVSIPQYFTRIDSINNTPGTDTAVLKALQRVKISGSVLRTDSTFWNDYNGEIFLKIFDVSKFISVFDLGFYFNFRLDGGLIFAGRTNVTNGRWELEFVVPKDISYRNGSGKLIGYFNNNESDGSGYSDKFILNGIDSTAAVDTTGPQIDIFMGDRNFRSGDVVNQNSNLIADFFDENGMNLTGTIGHKIEAIINNNENSKIDLTPFYNATSGYQNGSLEYLLDNLESGDYNVKIKAWDTYNNYSISSIDFKVMNNSSLALENIYNYPNPMRDNTSFLFNHNFDAPLDVRIKIYTVSGRLIKELNQSNITDKFVKIDWDGRDDDGDNIANGTYIYRLVVKSQDGNFNETSTGKIAKLN